MNLSTDPKYFNNYYFHRQQQQYGHQPVQSSTNYDQSYDRSSYPSKHNHNYPQSSSSWMMHNRGGSYYPPDPGYGGSGYGSTSYSNYPGQAITSATQYNDAYHHQTAQHNHPPYYPSHSQQSYGSEQQPQQNPYDTSYHNGYPPGQPPNRGYDLQQGAVSNPYGASSQSMYTGYGGQQSYQQMQQQPPAPPAPPPPPPPTIAKPSYPPAPTTLNLKSSSKNPYGQTGPYGSDATNPYVDYYRKLYYPYDPITGEYMKDATPPGDTATTNLLPNVMPDMSSAMQRQHAHSSGRGFPGAGMEPSNMMSQYYGPYDNENDSLLLCCDFLIPRPNIKCLLITLFILLVLIILIAVIRFLVSSGGDQSEELATLLEQTCMLLLIGAFLDLVWIIGIYFTSRRTRHQIANILSCATNPSTIETSLAPEYNGYLYSNSTAHHQHHHAHHHSGRGVNNSTRPYGASGGPSASGYRYANNYV